MSIKIFYDHNGNDDRHDDGDHDGGDDHHGDCDDHIPVLVYGTLSPRRVGHTQSQGQTIPAE